MGAGVGSGVDGRGVGAGAGTAVGFGTGTAVGWPGATDGSGVEGCGVGRGVGFADGRGVGCGVGLAVGSGRGTEVGIGDIEGAHVSSRVGPRRRGLGGRIERRRQRAPAHGAVVERRAARLERDALVHGLAGAAQIINPAAHATGPQGS